MPAPPARVPQQERDFLEVVKRGQTAVSEGNDITLVTAARDRSGGVCALLPRDGRVEDWVGTINKVGTIFGGKQGQLSVTIGQDIKLRTWSRESEDERDHTLIDPNSDVYRALADLEVRRQDTASTAASSPVAPAACTRRASSRRTGC